jgi:phosphohistidine phosphatase
MPVLSLLRHAKAAQPLLGQQDFDRPLTERGRRDAAWAGKILSHTIIDLALVSAACRTRETWEIAAAELAQSLEPTIERELYLCSAAKLIARLRECPQNIENVLVIGHNPCMQEVALWLSGHSSSAGASAVREKFPTCALAIFDVKAGSWDRLSSDQASLRRFLTPH